MEGDVAGRPKMVRSLPAGDYVLTISRGTEALRQAALTLAARDHRKIT